MSFRIIGRSEWGADDTYLGPAMAVPTDELWLHHTVTGTSPELSVMRQIEAEATRPDLAGRFPYSFVVFPTGNVYEGQGWRRRGAHTPNHNYGYGVSLAGNYDANPVPTVMVDAVRWLIAESVRVGVLTFGTYPTGGHRDVYATACPGRNTYARLAEFRQPWNPPPPPDEEDDMPIDHAAAAVRYDRAYLPGGTLYVQRTTDEDVTIVVYNTPPSTAGDPDGPTNGTITGWGPFVITLGAGAVNLEASAPVHVTWVA